MGELAGLYDFYSNLWQAGKYHANAHQVTYEDWCGPGGSGPNLSGHDAACHVHDVCYDTNGLHVLDNFNPNLPGNKAGCPILRLFSGEGWDTRSPNESINLAGQHTSSFDVINHWENEGWAYWGAAPVSFYAGGITQFDHQDWLGTERMRTRYDGSPLRCCLSEAVPALPEPTGTSTISPGSTMITAAIPITPSTGNKF